MGEITNCPNCKAELKSRIKKRTYFEHKTAEFWQDKNHQRVPRLKSRWLQQQMRQRTI